jgi:lantibiotic modifying enzyme
MKIMSSYEETIAKTEAFIDQQRIESPQGFTWRRAPDAGPAHTLYHGSAGVILFYLELYRFSGDAEHLTKATQGGLDLVAYVNDKAANEQFLTIGLHSGWPGYVFVLYELYKATDDVRFRDAAIVCLDRIIAQSNEIGAGIGWIEPIPFADITGITGEREIIDLSVGAAGAGLVLLYAHRQGLSPDALSLARQTADRLLEVAEETPDGLRWLMMVDMAFPFTAPNFAHGGAGVGYFLADLYSETHHQPYLDAAVSAAEYVASRTHPQEHGFLVCHTEEEKPASTFYLGVCHGPAGTGRLMYLLNELTSDNRWMDWLEQNFEGLVSTGAPETRSSGLWQNLGQCCGDAGIGDYALFLYKATQKAEYLSFAQRIADHMTTQSTVSGFGCCWDQAEHRSRPDFTEQQTGYMQGAAGIGSFLLHLEGVRSGRDPKIIMPDVPFATS